ncbi:hypothetical protein [Fulvimarina endophytica]|uniref:hypothetical protein n=1 Tax=Fulvimarina endophytica TaxID=2293836 RepID=UPI0011C05D45|nr:hypothetical protein [Fulvimarina endophytica]
MEPEERYSQRRKSVTDRMLIALCLIAAVMAVILVTADIGRDIDHGPTQLTRAGDQAGPVLDNPAQQ